MPLPATPTPSEAEALNPDKTKRRGLLRSLFDPEKLKDPKEFLRTIITLTVVVLLILFVVYQQNIVRWLTPFADWMRRTPGGWLIPIVILIVLSFPPLFGHEIIAILVGDVWGVGLGFCIVAAGTILGELATYWVFRCFCMARGEKMEEKKVKYALLAEVIRQGGFKIACIIRYSAIPGHLTTAIFATCGMNVFLFLAAAFLSLPKQLATVYLGDAQSGEAVSPTMRTIKGIVIVATTLITIFSMRYIRSQQDKVKVAVIYRRRKARQAKLRMAAGVDPEAALGSPTSSSPAEHTQAWSHEAAAHVPTQPPPDYYGYSQPHASSSRMHVVQNRPAVAPPQIVHDAGEPGAWRR
ncbi:hypothetical protein BN946_scf184641.g5 [Trametes cinnabarina]|uniref:Golgi apparatus membrane protein TVP38 n=1 Tax=Pycnoporus cinnabarinus TaxID=5643 RepID=A0A060SQN2_PYCCI|nr:hypothetical protein BN946_scf184641.g5 [Trametes cinnabarina]